LCLTGPVIYKDGGPIVKSMWGEKDQWINITQIYSKAFCTLEKDGKYLLFAVVEKPGFGVNWHTLDESIFLK